MIERKPITEHQIMNILLNRDAIIKRCEEQEIPLREMIVNEIRLSEIPDFPSPSGNNLRDFVRSSRLSDLSDTIEKLEKTSRELVRTIQIKLKIIIDDKEQVDRVLASYNAISGMGRPYEVLDESVFHNASGKELAMKYDVSQKTISVWKAEALKEVTKIYNMKITTQEINNFMLYGIKKGQEK